MNFKNTATAALAGVAILGVAMFASPDNANALAFKFTIIGDYGVPDTVEGRIFGLQDNLSGQAASSIIIDSLPPAFGGLAGGNDAVLWTDVNPNSFDVLSGQIIAATFYSADFPAPSNAADPFDTLRIGAGEDAAECHQSLNLDRCFSHYWKHNGNTTDEISTLQGSDGILFSAIPAPSTSALFGLGLAGLGLAARRRKTA